jgi:hypothetical protein
MRKMIILLVLLCLIIIALSVAGAQRRQEQLLWMLAPEKMAKAQTERRKAEWKAIALLLALFAIAWVIGTVIQFAGH